MASSISTSTGRDSDKFMLRLPEGMRARIASAAEENRRSMNAEIVATLEQHYPSIADIDKLIEQTNELARLKATAGASHRGLDPLITTLRVLLRELMGGGGLNVRSPDWKPPPEQDE